MHDGDRLPGNRPPADVDEEVDEEIAFHLDRRVDDLVASGLSRSDAERQALREFGNVDRARTSLRRETKRIRRRRRLAARMDRLGLDLRTAIRRIVRHPGYALVSVVILAMTIGANTVVLGIADAVLFRPLPYTDADGLRTIGMELPETGERFTRVADRYVEALSSQTNPIGEIATAVSVSSLTVESPRGLEAVPLIQASANYFEVLGVRPALGRLFHTGDVDGADRIAVLSHGAWIRRFGGDVGIVGESVLLGERSFEIVGVLPPDFFFPTPSLQAPEVVTVAPPTPAGSTDGSFDPIVRLAPGMSPERAQAEMDRVTAPLADPGSNDWGTRPALSEVRPVLYRTGGPIVRLVLSASALLLLLGCVNLANLTWARNRRLEREVGVRRALGATPSRIARPMVIEATLLSLLAGAVAVGLAVMSFDRLLPLVPPVAFGAGPVGIDLRVGIITVVLGALAGLAFSLGPALVTARRGARVDRGAVSARPRGSRSPWVRRPLVAIQVATTLVLVFGAVVTGRALIDVVSAPLGFVPEGVVVARVLPPEGISGADASDFYRTAARTIEARPNVLSAGAASSVPLVRPGGWAAVTSAENGGSIGMWMHVLPGYIETAGIPVVRGRTFSRQDAEADAPVTVVSRALASRAFGSGDPIGETLVDERGRALTVIGVVDDVRVRAGGDATPPAYALPGDRTRTMAVLVRTASVSPEILDEIQSELIGLSPDRIASVSWWTDSIAGLTAFRNPRFQTLVLGVFGGLALGLTAIGVFGVVASSVSARTREFGIRMALGSTSARVVRLVVAQSIGTVIVGLIAGLLATRWLSGLAESQLFDVDVNDPATLAAAVLTVTVAALAAAYLPARRAGRIDPAVAQRVE